MHESKEPIRQQAGRQILAGASGQYNIDPSTPLTYGRLSVLFSGVAATGEAVCVKLFRDKLESSEGEVDFERELQAILTLRHAHILSLIDFGTARELDNRPFLVMPLCSRGNLRSLLQTRSFLPPDEALRYLRDISEALDYSHSCGIIHGDIKPENILLGAEGRAVLADFGAAKYKLVSAQQSSTVGGWSGSFTELYAAPEQFVQGKQSVRSDVYSFAMVAYELLTGRLPVDTNVRPYERMRAKEEGRLTHALDANPLLLPSVADALMRALSTVSKQRQSSAGELVSTMLYGLRRTSSSSFDVPLVGGSIVFVVHGRDEATKERVARVLSKLGTTPLILHERPSVGQTLIEKLEGHSDVSAAVVLLTADDVGGMAGTTHQPRARQNVILELGYFLAKLGRRRTIALYESSVELPSDLGGVVYVPLDTAGSWRLELARELRAAGVPVRIESLIE